MSPEQHKALLQLIANGLIASDSMDGPQAEVTSGSEISIVRSQRCSGGCIHHAELVELSTGRLVFVKFNRSATEMFQAEARGLAELSKAGAVRTPQVLAVGRLDDVTDGLILEGLLTGSPRSDFWEVFGRQFAELHRNSNPYHGFEGDNFIGSSKQPNAASHNWSVFFRQQRLEFQLRLVRQRSLGSIELYKRMERLLEKLERLLGPQAEPPALLHGDLWSGNYMVDEAGMPVIFDPAIYYGDREADLAMPLLFGGFPEAFFRAYDEAWTLRDGWRDRVPLYQLYHLLNHLNLFGSGYLDSCLEIVRRFA